MVPFGELAMKKPLEERGAIINILSRAIDGTIGTGPVDLEIDQHHSFIDPIATDSVSEELSSLIVDYLHDEHRRLDLSKLVICQRSLYDDSGLLQYKLGWRSDTGSLVPIGHYTVK